MVLIYSWFDVIPFDYIFIGGLWWFGGFCFWVFYMVFWFHAGLMFFWFSGGSYFLIFWCFFDDFLIFLRFFFLAFALLLLTKMGTTFKILLQFIFFRVYWLASMRWPVTSHRVKFTALRLVFNRICKSIKKYKNVTLWAFKASTFTGCMINFLRFYLIKPYGM